MVANYSLLYGDEDIAIMAVCNPALGTTIVIESIEYHFDIYDPLELVDTPIIMEHNSR